jgi:hypothetical protein
LEDARHRIGLLSLLQYNLSTGGRFKQAFAERDKKQTMTDLRGISSNWLKPVFPFLGYGFCIENQFFYCQQKKHLKKPFRATQEEKFRKLIPESCRKGFFIYFFVFAGNGLFEHVRYSHRPFQIQRFLKTLENFCGPYI